MIKDLRNFSGKKSNLGWHCLKWSSISPKISDLSKKRLFRMKQLSLSIIILYYREYNQKISILNLKKSQILRNKILKVNPFWSPLKKAIQRRMRNKWNLKKQQIQNRITIYRMKSNQSIKIKLIVIILIMILLITRIVKKNIKTNKMWIKN